MKKIHAVLMLLTIGIALIAAAVDARETVTRGNRLAIDIASDGRIVMNLAGGLWVVPRQGGNARLLHPDLSGVERPRWSPDASHIAYEATVGDAHGIWLHKLADGTSQPISDALNFDLHPAWHPHGERLVYASDRRDSGFDLWETDLPTGLQWRLSNHPGDETDPAWSADGRHLVYVHQHAGQWSLVLRRHGLAEETLLRSDSKLSGPSWRPDGSLITYWRDTADGPALEMVILSEPRLIRHYADGEKFMTAPVAWLDRQRLFYTAAGMIRRRQFNSWTSHTVPFRAIIETSPELVAQPERRSLPRIDEPAGRLVVHAARLFDGIDGTYQTHRDIVIDGGQIVALEAHADRPGTIVIDMGDLVVMPGLVDARARLPVDTSADMGPLLLTTGVTTVVASHEQAEQLNATWSGKALPGPRLLSADDFAVREVSGLADALTPGLDVLLGSRQAGLVGLAGPVARRHTEPPRIEHGATEIVAGSRRSGLPAGIGLHAELRALQAAGLKPEQALRAAGVNAAAALGVDPSLGRVAVGAVADLVFVDGDPLHDVSDTLKIVAVVRNGRFFSVAGLIERAEPPQSVE